MMAEVGAAVETGAERADQPDPKRYGGVC